MAILRHCRDAAYDVAAMANTPPLRLFDFALCRCRRATRTGGCFMPPMISFQRSFRHEVYYRRYFHAFASYAFACCLRYLLHIRAFCRCCYAVLPAIYFDTPVI